jgi:hypothetical protein
MAVSLLCGAEVKQWSFALFHAGRKVAAMVNNPDYADPNRSAMLYPAERPDTI